MTKSLIETLKPALKPQYLTIRQLVALLMIYKQKKMDHTELCDAMGISGAACSRAMDGLGIMGFLIRERRQDDRRKVYGVLTEAGREFVKSLGVP